MLPDGGVAGARRTFLAGAVPVGNEPLLSAIRLPSPASGSHFLLSPTGKPLPLSLAYLPFPPADSLIVGNYLYSVESMGTGFPLLVLAHAGSRSRLHPSAPIYLPSTAPRPRFWAIKGSSHSLLYAVPFLGADCGSFAEIHNFSDPPYSSFQ